ncbi:hypothetical protein [Candidatus Halocynthiibacter alkanivorans]|uniref:hypothetical protein n=1 Tax=Candidatus Halocynthiibacter alkanivorans TaxID=2267619 RepID=UPI00109D8154|nr:hypothetical protein [Candidatus Halocynthiibacter alkanivorans]
MTRHFLDVLVEHANVDHPIGGNCNLLRVSSRQARRLNSDDRLGKYALIWSEDTGTIVTVMPLHRGKGGARYRRQN